MVGIQMKVIWEFMEKISLTCFIVYIGQTGRELRDRVIAKVRPSSALKKKIILYQSLTDLQTREGDSQFWKTSK